MTEDLLNISDGNLYTNSDMVKINCQDCKGCSSCCEDMGQSIWLDPYDVYQLTGNLGKTMEELLQKEVEFHVEDGLILPNLAMAGNVPVCGFLNEEGRCSIHGFRPGYCRLFPLGRNYEEDELSYFVLAEACPAPNKSKVKIQKWLNVTRLRDYEKFLVDWHRLTKNLRAFYQEQPQEEAVIKAINMKFLQLFYLSSYTEEDFYKDFYQRYAEMESFIHTLGLV